MPVVWYERSNLRRSRCIVSRKAYLSTGFIGCKPMTMPDRLLRKVRKDVDWSSTWFDGSLKTT